MKIREYLCPSNILGVFACAGILFSVTWAFLDVSRQGKFDRIQKEALYAYADTNRDGFVSAAEQDAFEQAVISRRGVTSRHDSWPQYSDGRKVPRGILTQWIREYTSSVSRAKTTPLEAPSDQ